ncbi:MAG: chromate efflux transporter [Chloroflexi bacterium]|nr:chromate efflux transporter [Chloroflexota bacterium]
MSEPTPTSPLREVIALFLRLGLTAFGGPAAHLAIFRDEVVTRRRWMSEDEFLDRIGAANLIPGPTSTEVAIYIGYRRAGWRGLVAAGLCFILPATLIVLACAWLYKQYGTTPAASSLLYGIKPVIIAVIAQAIWGLAPRAMKTPLLAAIGVAVCVLYFLGINELVLLFGGAAVMLARWGARRAWSGGTTPALVLFGLPALARVAIEIVPVSLDTLFLTFLKIGALLYGSGYVLLAFLRNDFVERLGWLTNQQLLDAVAIGQFTPGPVFTTATFIGYLVLDLPGAFAATVAIFLPSFIFVALTQPLIPRMRRSALAGALLDGVNAGALGLMAAVAVQLAQAAIVDWLTIVLAVAAAILLVRFRVNSTWLILGGGLAGFAFRLIAG